MAKDWNYTQHLMQSWMVGYEKAILKKHYQLSKKVTDDACAHAVEDFTQRMCENGIIAKVRGKEFDSFAGCINHHIDNLIDAGMWKEEHRPIIEEIEPFEIVVKIPICTFREGCKWALEEDFFSPVQNFRCQRVGSFVGAIKKYLKDEVMPDGMKADYFMTKIHEDDGCSAVVYGRQGFRYRLLLSKYDLQSKGEQE